MPQIKQGFRERKARPIRLPKPESRREPSEAKPVKEPSEAKPRRERELVPSR